MERASFDLIWSEIQTETYNRSKGAFKRALWYGGRTEGFKGIPNSIVAHFGNGKGLRKVIRNSPRMLATQGIGAAAGVTLTAFAPPAAVMQPLVSELIAGVIDFSISITRLAIEGIALAIVDPVIAQSIAHTNKKGGKSPYRKLKAKVFGKDEPKSLDEELRKEIKMEMKDLQKGKGFQIIDRNLVKMKDAKAEIEPALKELTAIANDYALYRQNNSTGGVPAKHIRDKLTLYEGKQTKAIHDTLRSISETEYYIKKITHMVDDIQNTLTNLDENKLVKLNEYINSIEQSLMEYIIQTVDDSE